MKGCLLVSKRDSDLGFSNSKKEDFNLWHRRLGHPSRKAMNLFSEFLFNNAANRICEICSRAKQTRKPFPISFDIATHHK